ncbi:helix-turn-helix transcriptional regulator [Silvimonas sp.]|uniref:helix-turn-helix domain-containing protein n=1 Tax=Silvimonas sp. TaxID=2650811 RepID=UPI00283D8544|nr:helix-turn-helix transcriptional regulator [Silvimonas sp.]MDR3428999.1 helix-turn-helix transcriptional regulator [Silvimonas sp.]
MTTAENTLFDGVPERLVSERTRLGLGQEEFAALGGVSRNTQSRYEKSASKIDLNYLDNLARYGVDAVYVLTGQRTNREELRLVAAFNAAPEAVRVAVLAALGANPIREH